MSIDLVKQMEKSESIIELEKRLASEGKTFPNFKKYVSWLRSEWSNINAEEIKRAVETIPEEPKLPTLTLTQNGVNYHIHGICHGGSMLLTPGWHLRRNVRNFLQEEFLKFEDDSDVCYTEERFSNVFNQIGSLQEIKDISKGRIQHSSALGTLLKFSTLPFLIGYTMSSAMFMNAKLAMAGESNSSKQNYYLMKKSLFDERYQEVVANWVKAKELPQPFDLEAKHILYRSEKSLGREVIYGENISSTPERSMWTTRELVSMASRGKIREFDTIPVENVHYMCGAGHTSQIKYFLENPGYTLSGIELYLMDKNK